MQQKLEMHISGAIFPPCSKVCIITPFQLDSLFFIFCSPVTPRSLERKPAPNNPNTRENTYASTFKKPSTHPRKNTPLPLCTTHIQRVQECYKHETFRPPLGQSYYSFTTKCCCLYSDYIL